MKWEEFNNQSQIYLYWDYCAACPETEQISFEEFDEMMRDSRFRESHNC